jgi:hypothetical protein
VIRRLGYARTSSALSAAIVFLTTHAGIAQASLLPYKQPLVALAKFFDRHPQASARSLDLLSRWVWRGAWSGAHQGDTATTRTTLESIDEDEDRSVQRLLQTVPAKEPTEVRAPAYSFRNARSKLDILGLLSLGPRHLVTGVRIPPASVVGPEMIASIVATSEARTTIAGRIVHPSVPKLRAALAHSEAAVRESHGVSIEDFAQVLDVRPTHHDKYRSANFETIARILGEVAPASAEEFMRRLVFNVAIGNGDAHVKNWSLRYEDRLRPLLSPAYDLVSTIQYLPPTTSG